MKRNILARRAASAALAACMMFSLSAPALAASTDALLQQSTAAKSAVSVLDEENGMQVGEIVQDFNIIINGQSVTSENYNNILGGILYYNIEEKTLKLKDGQFFNGALTITAPEDVSIDLEADASHVVKGDLTVRGAKDVKVTKLAGGNADAAIEGKAEITCSGDVILKSFGGSHGDGRNLIGNGLTVHRANTVTTEGGIGGETIIDCTGDIKLGNEWGTTVSKLMVNSANNVTMTSGSW